MCFLFFVTDTMCKFFWKSPLLSRIKFENTSSHSVSDNYFFPAWRIWCYECWVQCSWVGISADWLVVAPLRVEKRKWLSGHLCTASLKAAIVDCPVLLGSYSEWTVSLMLGWPCYCEWTVSLMLGWPCYCEWTVSLMLGWPCYCKWTVSLSCWDDPVTVNEQFLSCWDGPVTVNEQFLSCWDGPVQLTGR